MDAPGAEHMPAKPSVSTPKDPGVLTPRVSETPSPVPLTPEEQMAAFEKDLKENDWGHQPC